MGANARLLGDVPRLESAAGLIEYRVGPYSALSSSSVGWRGTRGSRRFTKQLHHPMHDGSPGHLEVVRYVGLGSPASTRFTAIRCHPSRASRRSSRASRFSVISRRTVQHWTSYTNYAIRGAIRVDLL